MKKFFIITIAAIGLLLVLIKKDDMNLQQSLMKIMYPAIRKISAITGSKTTINTNKEAVPATQSFYSLSVKNITGQMISFNEFKGKKILVVNTASACGFTGQLEELQQLQEKFAGKLLVIGFPANDFREQETGSNEDIAAFCKRNYGVSFLLAEKSSVIKGNNQHPVFQWLTDKSKNGWNDKAPEWNFSKYLVDENGVLLNYFGSAISPLGDEVVKKI